MDDLATEEQIKLIHQLIQSRVDELQKQVTFDIDSSVASKLWRSVILPPDLSRRTARLIIDGFRKFRLLYALAYLKQGRLDPVDKEVEQVVRILYAMIPDQDKNF